jgi:hypothetical protein
MVNSVVNGEQRIDISQEDQFTKRILTMGSKKKHSSSGMRSSGGDEENPLEANSADQARIIVERMAVLSVCSSDSILRKYEKRQAAKDAAGKSGKKRLRKLAKDADLDGFDFRGERRSASIPDLNVSNHSVTNRSGDDVSVSAGSTFTSATNLTLKGPKKDTAAKRAPRLQSPGLLGSNSRDGGRSKLQGLLASTSKDANANGRGRKAAVEPSPGKARNAGGRRSKTNQGNISLAQESFDTFGFGAKSPQGSIGSRNFSTPGNQGFDPFFDAPSSESAFMSTDSGGTKALVNVALNEDLTCFYKLSRLSSCSVEGVVQVQVTSNVDRTVPFSLFIKDPSNYIQTIQENKMYAKSVADQTKQSDFAFAVSVPKAEEYFPVMRYKCGEDLRPVPIVSSSLVFMLQTVASFHFVFDGYAMLCHLLLTIPSDFVCLCV